MFKMTREGWIKVARGSVIAGAGAGFVYGLEALDAVNWGEYDVLVASAASVLINLARKWVAKG